MITLISTSSDLMCNPIRVLSSYLRQKGFATRLLFLPDREIESHRLPSGNVPSSDIPYSQKTADQVVDLCADSDLIGASLLTSDFYNTAYLTKKLKEKLNIPVIWGGKHPSAKPEEALSFADMVCIGEGEDALAELVERIKNGKDCYDTENIWFNNNGTIIKNPVRHILQDLDLIPFPDYSFDNHFVWEAETGDIIELNASLLKRYLFREPPFFNLIPYETLWSRGCPFSCSFCFSFKRLYKGQKYLRFRSVENIIGELEVMTKQLGYIGKIHLYDDNIFVLPTGEIEQFCRLYKERVGLPLSFAAHPKDINEEKLSHLVDAGMIAIDVGIQTGSKRTQKLYKRSYPDTVVSNAVQAINRFKESLYVSYDIIIDNPYETNEDLVQTIELVSKFPKPRYFKMFSLCFFPGTELYEKAKKDGTLPDEEELKAYKKNFLSLYHRKKKYLNLVFSLLNRNIPSFVISILINRYMILLLDRPFIMNPVWKMISFLRIKKG